MTADRPLRLKDCAGDSPYFRSRVSFYENATEDLDKKLRRVGAICRERRELFKKDSALSLELRTIAEGFMKRHVKGGSTLLVTSEASDPVDNSDQSLLECMEQAVSCLRQLDDQRERFHEQVAIAVVEPLRKFVSSRVQEVRSIGQQYREANAECSAAVHKLCACKKHELSAMAEASVSLHEARLQQHVTSTSYALALNRLHCDKQPQFVQSMVDFVMCEMTTFRLGNSTFAGLDETLSSTYTTLQEITDARTAVHNDESEKSTVELAHTMTKRLATLETFHRVDLHLPANTAAANIERLRADTQRRHGKRFSVPEHVKMGRKSSLSPCASRDTTQLTKAGYLLHGEHRPVVGISWHCQYFEIEAGCLNTVTEGDALMKQFGVEAMNSKHDKRSVKFDLRLCLVKPAVPADTDRNFCFRVIHPSQTLLLQAESSSEMNEWMSALQNAAALALDNSSSVSAPNSPPMSTHARASRAMSTGQAVPATSSPGSGPPPEIMAADGNAVCADCAADAPRWASVNLGLTLCIECSGIHRSLGVHISQVRSLTLDEMRPEWTATLTEVGNKRSNEIFELFLPPGFNRQFASSSDRRLFIKQKYAEMVFADDDQREKILAKRELERAALALERERAEEERQQWEMVEAAAHSAPVAEKQEALNSPSMFRRVRTSLISGSKLK